MSHITEKTGCLPPCQYTEYSIGIELHEHTEDLNYTYLHLERVGSTLKVKKEILMYPFTSLVAEVGGALGLFLGFSFLMIWDIMEIVKSRFQR